MCTVYIPDSRDVQEKTSFVLQNITHFLLYIPSCAAKYTLKCKNTAPRLHPLAF